MDFQTIKLHIINSIAHIIMNRPERRNAFNQQMIEDLTQAFSVLHDHDCRAIVLEGEGSAFSAGADLNWMSEMKEYSYEENLADAMKLATLLEVIYTHPKPVLAKVHGAAMGGGVGLVAACDLAVALRGTVFAFSEVRLGLVPATISPYVIRKIGESAARHYMLTAQKFDANTAKELGLVHHVAVQGDLEATLRGYCTAFSLAGPQALTVCKRLIQRVGEEPISQIKTWTAEIIANLRIGEEGQEGIQAFLDSRDPQWQ